MERDSHYAGPLGNREPGLSRETRLPSEEREERTVPFPGEWVNVELAMDTPNTWTAILERLFVPEQGDLPADAARYLLELDFGVADRERMNILAAKARAGELDPAEEAEIRDYRQVSHLLALLQSKARKSLPNKGVSA